MKLLLDTHALIWWLGGDERMRRRDAIVDPANEKFVSAISALEIAAKYRLGRLPDAALLAQSFETCVEEQGFEAIALTATQGRVAGSLPGPHDDRFGVQRIW